MRGLRLSTTASVAVGCAMVASCGSHAFVVSKSCTRRAAALSEDRRNALQTTTMGPMDGIFEGPVLDLRGGKTTGSKKGSSTKAKESSTKGKSSKASQAKKGPKKPTFVATFKAFFHSLFNPHFALKLQAKNEQHHTVHGSGSA